MRAAVLDGATPVDNSIFVSAPRYGQAALDLCSTTARRTRLAPRRFPTWRRFDLILKRAEAAPIAVDGIDPRDGKMRRSVIDRDAAAGFVRGALYAGFTRSVAPYAITQGAKGDFGPLIALGSATGEWSAETMSLGSMLGILCGEDQASARGADKSAMSFGFMRDSYVRMFTTACSVWPYRTLPVEMTQAFTSTVPAMAIWGWPIR